jgi:hypothetical protein
VVKKLIDSYSNARLNFVIPVVTPGIEDQANGDEGCDGEPPGVIGKYGSALLNIGLEVSIVVLDGAQIT